MRYAIVNKDGLIVNVCEWDGVTEWSPPEGHEAIQCKDEGIHDTYDFSSGEFTRYHLKRGDKHPMEDLIKKVLDSSVNNVVV